MNWKELLFRILDCIDTEEGYVFDADWVEYGITEEQRKRILEEWQNWHTESAEK